MDKNDILFGIRAILEAIEAGREVDRILLKRDLQGDLSKELLATAKLHRIPIQYVPIERINRITRKNHQGAIAFLSAVSYQPLEEIVPLIYESGKSPFLVVLDSLTDVRNFGAIARTCECAGVDAIVIPQKGSVSVSADAVKTSAGALMHLPVCRVENLRQALRFLQESGLQLVAASEKGAKPYTESNYTGPTAFIMGSEDCGISPDVLRICDEMVQIPQFGTIGSLNVSVATGILLYEAVRQRLNAQ